MQREESVLKLDRVFNMVMKKKMTENKRIKRRTGMDFRTDKLLHGGDYNPEQWLKRPDILAKDIDMLEESGCNVVSLGIFSWSTLEPEEGVFNFGWLQEIIDKLYKRGISTILATPSGARPKWMADKYPEVLRVDETRHRALFGFRQDRKSVV